MAALKRPTLWPLTGILLNACLVAAPDSADTTGTSRGDEDSGVGTTSNADDGVQTSATSDAGDGHESSTGEPLQPAESSSSAAVDSTSETGVEPHPNGFLMCISDAECESGVCYMEFSEWGVCSECRSDADCADVTGYGCTWPDIASPDFDYARCNQGELAAGCNSDAACADGRTCELIWDSKNFDFAACSECGGNDDCAAGQLCSTTLVLLDFTGYRGCVDEASVPIGTTCDVDGDGDLACASGNCAFANIDNLGHTGICSECDEDADCLDGQTCAPADVDTFYVMAIPAVCV